MIDLKYILAIFDIHRWIKFLHRPILYCEYRVYLPPLCLNDGYFTCLHPILHRFMLLPFQKLTFWLGFKSPKNKIMISAFQSHILHIYRLRGEILGIKRKKIWEHNSRTGSWLKYPPPFFSISLSIWIVDFIFSS